MNQISLAEYRQQIESAIADGRHNEAIVHGKHILKHYPKDVDAYWLLGKALLETGQDKQAADMFQRVVSADPDKMLAWVGLSEVAERQKNLEAAIGYLERAFELATDNNAVAGHLRHLYGELEGREPERLQLTQGALARLYLRGDLLSRAITELGELLEDHPDRIDLQVALAEALWRSGRRPEAADVCQDILEEHRYNLRANLILGEIWTSSGREGGEIYLERAQALDPENRAAQELFGAASPLPLNEPRITPAKYDADADSGGIPGAEGGPAIKLDVPQWLRRVVGGTAAHEAGEIEASKTDREEVDVDERLGWMGESDEDGAEAELADEDVPQVPETERAAGSEEAKSGTRDPDDSPRYEPEDDRLAWLSDPEEEIPTPGVTGALDPEDERFAWMAESDGPDAGAEEPDDSSRSEPEDDRLAWLTELEEEEAAPETHGTREPEEERVARVVEPDEPEAGAKQPDERVMDRLGWLTEPEEVEPSAEMPVGQQPADERLTWLTELEEPVSGAQPPEDSAPQQPDEETVEDMAESEEVGTERERQLDRDVQEPKVEGLEWLVELERTEVRAEQPKEPERDELELREIEETEDLERAEIPDWLRGLAPFESEPADEPDLDALAALLERDSVADDVLSTEEIEGIEDLELSDSDDLAWLEQLAGEEEEEIQPHTVVEREAGPDELERRPTRTADEMAAEDLEPTAEELAALEPVTEEPAAEEPAPGVPAAEEPTPEVPIAEEPVIEEPAPDVPVAEEPIAEELAPEEPVTEEPLTEKPAPEVPVAEEPTAEELAPEEPVAEEPLTDEPAPEVPVAEEPTAEELAPEEPVAEEPLTEEPAPDVPAPAEPVAEEPVAEEPAPDVPVAEQPIAEELAPEEPVTEEPLTEEPVPEVPSPAEPVAEEPVAEVPAAEVPVAEEPIAEELAPEKPVTEEPLTEEPAPEVPAPAEPVAEEPVAGEPTPEELVAEEMVRAAEREYGEAEPETEEADTAAETRRLEQWEDTTELPEWLETDDLPLELDVLTWLEQLSEEEEERLRLQAEAEREARSDPTMRQVKPSPEEAIPEVEEVAPEEVAAPPEQVVEEPATDEGYGVALPGDVEAEEIGLAPATEELPAEDLGHFIARQRDYVEVNPEDREARLELGRVLWQADRPDEAMEVYGTLIDQAQLLDEIILDLEDYAAQWPDPSVKQVLGDAYVKADRLQDALVVYRDALGDL